MVDVDCTLLLLAAFTLSSKSGRKDCSSSVGALELDAVAAGCLRPPAAGAFFSGATLAFPGAAAVDSATSKPRATERS